MSSERLARLLPLWFTHHCLLEGFLAIPSKATDVLYCAVTRLLRCQYGFDIERNIVGGMDEVRRIGHVGLMEVGLELTRSAGAAIQEPLGSLRDVLEQWPSDHALTMLHLSMRPTQYKDFLIGMANGYVSLHESVAASDLLCPGTRDALNKIIHRERDSLKICLEELGRDEGRLARFYAGWAFAQEEIARCLE